MLAKTLEAVGRGRQKLHGRIATDDLGALADDTTTFQHSSDADYLAGLAALSDTPPAPAPRTPAPAPAPAQEPVYEPQEAYGYQQPDAYPAAYPQQPGYAPQEAYGYQQDPYAAPNGYAPQAEGAFHGYDAQQPGYDPNQAQVQQQGQPRAGLRPGRDQPLRHQHDQRGAAPCLRAGPGAVAARGPDWALSERSSILAVRSRVSPRSALPGTPSGRVPPSSKTESREWP